MKASGRPNHQSTLSASVGSLVGCGRAFVCDQLMVHLLKFRAPGFPVGPISDRDKFPGLVSMAGAIGKDNLPETTFQIGSGLCILQSLLDEVTDFMKQTP